MPMGVFDDFAGIVRADEPLAPYTWFRLGGPAAYLARPRTAEEVSGLIDRANAEGLPWRVLGGGSNLLVADEGVPGLVIHLESPAFSDVSHEGDRIEAGAAVPLTALISQAARAGLGGLENLTGIPGTVGGALRGNAGGRQGSIGPCVRRVTLVNGDGEIEERERDALDFEAGGSNLDDALVLSAEFALEPEDPEAVVRRMRRIWIVKKEHQPYGHQSCGMIFRNPNPELTAGALIERAGLKGIREGEAEVSERHADFIVAHPGASSADVIRLIDRIHQEVWGRLGYDLELQIQVWKPSPV
ncbi:MAG: UDP-N-acetylmuramate dehydrogenase [Isosphaeraceae bacterium]